jgi:hypothetical protein
MSTEIHPYVKGLYILKNISKKHLIIVGGWEAFKGALASYTGLNEARNLYSNIQISHSDLQKILWQLYDCPVNPPVAADILLVHTSGEELKVSPSEIANIIKPLLDEY